MKNKRSLHFRTECCQVRIGPVGEFACFWRDWYILVILDHTWNGISGYAFCGVRSLCSVLDAITVLDHLGYVTIFLCVCLCARTCFAFLCFVMHTSTAVPDEVPPLTTSLPPSSSRLALPRPGHSATHYNTGGPNSDLLRRRRLARLRRDVTRAGEGDCSRVRGGGGGVCVAFQVQHKRVRLGPGLLLRVG